MAAESITHLKEVLIVLGTAGLAIPVLKRAGISTVLGFLLVGILLGPHLLGGLAEDIPALSYLTIGDTETISTLGELGVVFLLFLIGLELPLGRLTTMRRLVFGLGGLQVLVSSIAIALAALFFGMGDSEAIVIGLALALSSTAIVVQILSEEKRLGSQAGRSSFSVLLMQDLSVVPILILLGLMAQPQGTNLVSNILLALLQAIVAVTLIVFVGRFALRPALRIVASANSPDLFMAAVLFIAIGTGAVATAAGLSMALGAFIAGLTLAETEFRRAIEAIIEPFKGLLLGAFFLLVGLGLNLALLAEKPLLILALAVGLIAGKALVLYALARAFQVARHAAFETALLLGPGGEFAFVIFAIAVASGMIGSGVNDLLLVVVTLTMITIPLLSWLAKPAVKMLRKPQADAGLAVPTGPLERAPDVIMAGFGRVGSLLAAMAREHKLQVLALDLDTAVVAKARKEGENVFYGDATDVAILRNCGIETAKALVLTMDNLSRADQIVRAAKQANPNLKIIARARDERHAMRLYEVGATEAVPETIESSLQLGEALLVELGIPMGLAIASVHERRDGFRKLLGRPNRRAEFDASRTRRRRKQTMGEQKPD